MTTFEDYRVLAQRTTNKSLSHREHVINAALGLCGEAGEVADLLKKNRMQGHELEVYKVLEELGDVLWYCAEAATHLKLVVSWDQAFQSVIDMSVNVDGLERLAVRLCKCAGVAAEKMMYRRPAVNDLCEVLYIVKTIAGHWGYHIIEVGERNIDKLKRRYPDEFDPNRSINREV